MKNSSYKKFNWILYQNRILLTGFFGAVIDYDNPKPLKIGILNDMVAEVARLGLPFSKTILRRALRYYTVRLRYQHSLKRGGARYDLLGNECGIVTEDQQKRANEIITHIHKLEKKKKWKKLAYQRKLKKAQKAKKLREAEEAKLQEKTD